MSSFVCLTLFKFDGNSCFCNSCPSMRPLPLAHDTTAQPCCRVIRKFCSDFGIEVLKKSMIYWIQIWITMQKPLVRWLSAVPLRLLSHSELTFVIAPPTTHNGKGLLKEITAQSWDHKLSPRELPEQWLYISLPSAEGDKNILGKKTIITFAKRSVRELDD